MIARPFSFSMTKIYTVLNKEESLPENHDIDEGEDEGEHAFRQSM